jgi:hypothetical protein
LVVHQGTKVLLEKPFPSGWVPREVTSSSTDQEGRLTPSMDLVIDLNVSD